MILKANIIKAFREALKIKKFLEIMRTRHAVEHALFYLRKNWKKDRTELFKKVKSKAK